MQSYVSLLLCWIIYGSAWSSLEQGKKLQHFLLDRVEKFTSLCLEQGQGFVESPEHPPTQIPDEYPPGDRSPHSLFPNPPRSCPSLPRLFSSFPPSESLKQATIKTLTTFDRKLAILLYCGWLRFETFTASLWCSPLMENLYDAEWPGMHWSALTLSSALYSLRPRFRSSTSLTFLPRHLPGKLRDWTKQKDQKGV